MPKPILKATMAAANWASPDVPLARPRFGWRPPEPVIQATDPVVVAHA